MQKFITKEALALKKLREIKGLNRPQAGVLIGLGHKSVEKFENGRTLLTRRRISEILSAYNFSWQDFEAVCAGKSEQIAARFVTKAEKQIVTKKLRRNYQKIITREVKTIAVLRKLKGYNKYQASRLCGYADCIIGHIESGRIDLRPTRIRHIVQSYGFTMEEFEHHLNSEVFLTDIQDTCIKIIKNLSEEKLKAVYPLLQTFKK